MILRIILLISIVFSQNTIGSWKSFSSFHSLKSCKSISENKVACLSNGGILQFDLEHLTNEKITFDDGLNKSNFQSFEIDNYQNIWIPSKNDNLIIDIWSSNKNQLIQKFEFEIDNISKMISDSLNMFAIYKNNDVVGLLHFHYDENWEYKDYYLNFGRPINEIYDFKIMQNEILLSSNLGILQGETNSNLKNSTSWNILESFNEECHFVDGNFIQWYCNDIIYTKLDSSNTLQVDLEIVGIIEIINSEYLYILTENKFLVLDNYSLIFEFENELSSPFINFFKDDNIIYITTELHGLLEFDINNLDNPSFYPIPSTSLNTKFSAITVLENDNLVGIGVDGIGVFNGFDWENYYPNSSEYSFDSNNFQNYELNYKLSNGGEGSIYPTWSVVESNLDEIIFANTQIRPNSPGYAGALIEYDLQNTELSVYDTTNQVLDGQDGIFNSAWIYRNLIINQIKKDSDGNIWVLNPYAEADSNIIAIRPKNSDDWVHIKAPTNEAYFLPTELDFDKQGRVWIGFQRRISMENETYSEGGLKILLIAGDLSSDFSYYWRDITNPEILPNENVWSVAIDKQDFIWVLTSGGIQGYSAENYSQTLNPIYLIDFYNYLPLFRGDHIRVDSQDNKWISTRHSGVKVILENTQYWPDAEGFTQENSGLLSNNVNDLAFDEENGFVWFATDLGVSRFSYPINSKHVENEKLLFHPNPFKISIDDELLIEGCFPNSTVMINDINGNHVKTFKAQYLGEASSQIHWNGKDKNGNLVNSGVYLVSSRGEDGRVKRGKLAVIKQ